MKKSTLYHGGPFAGYEVAGWRDKDRTFQVASMSAKVSAVDNLKADVRHGSYVWDRDDESIRHFVWR